MHNFSTMFAATPFQADANVIYDLESALTKAMSAKGHKASNAKIMVSACGLQYTISVKVSLKERDFTVVLLAKVTEFGIDLIEQYGSFKYYGIDVSDAGKILPKLYYPVDRTLPTVAYQQMVSG